MNRLLQRVSELALPANDYAIFGSGPLLVRGIIDAANDIDIICRGAVWHQVLPIGDLIHLDDYDVDIVSIEDGLITFGRSWGIGDFDVDELIETAEVIEGLPFVQLRHVIRYKKVAGRDKDLQHLELLEQQGLWQGA